MIDILVANAPLSDPTQPSLAVPTLTAYLRAQGLNVCARDLSIEAFDALLSLTNIQEAISKLQKRCIQGDEKFTRDFERLRSLALTLSPIVLNNLELAKLTFKDPEQFYNFECYKNAFSILKDAFQIINAAYFPTHIEFTSYHIFGKLIADAIINHVSDSDCNVFRQYFIDETVPSIKQLNPRLIALSVTYDSQFLPALTLCHLLKASLPGTPVVLGGAYLTAMADRIQKSSFLWDFAEAIVIYEGESALVELCKRTMEDEDFWGINNVLIKKDLKLSSQRVRVEDLSTLPTPDFSHVPFDRYLIPEPVLPVQSHRGCYWGKCTFCSVSRATRVTYRERPIKAFFDDLKTLENTYGVKIFCICDDATPVNYMRQLAEHIRNERLPYCWWTEARFEKALDSETCELLAKGGCLHLVFGFESASERILARMQKGTSLEVTKKILRACKDAGISVNLQSFFWFSWRDS